VCLAVACSFIVLVFTVSLHVSAYMAIFRCVGKKARSRILQAYANKMSYTLEDGNVGRNSEDQHNKAARRGKHNLQYPLYIYIQQIGVRVGCYGLGKDTH
jgi:hypothetical protein